MAYQKISRPGPRMQVGSIAASYPVVAEWEHAYSKMKRNMFRLKISDMKALSAGQLTPSLAFWLDQYESSVLTPIKEGEV